MQAPGRRERGQLARMASLPSHSSQVVLTLIRSAP